MKVPQPLTGRTKASSQKVGYASAAQADFTQLGAAGQRLSVAVGAYQEKVEAQKKFGAVKSMSDWQTATQQRLVDMRRESPDDDATYFERASATLADEENKFISGLASEFQEQFSVQTREFANGLRLNELKFDNEKKDEYFAKGIATNVERSKLQVDADPEQLARERAVNRDLIMTSGLSEDAKAEALFQANGALEKAAYRKKALAEEKMRLNNPTAVQAFTDKVFGAETGGNPKAAPITSSAKGLGGFIEGTWAQFIGEKHPELYGQEMYDLRMDEGYMREATAWYAEKNANALRKAGAPVDEGMLYLGHFADGPMAAKIYNSPAGTSIESVMSEGAIKANPFLKGMTTDEVVEWAYKKMDSKQAYSQIDESPDFANVPLEDRILMREQAKRDAQNEVIATQKEQLARVKAAENELFVGLEDGRFGSAHIDQAREKGLLSDYEDLRKAKSIIERGDAANKDLKFLLGELQNPSSALSQDSTEVKNGMNALTKQNKWVERLTSGNAEDQQSAFAEIANIAQSKQVISPNLVDSLVAMSQGADWSSAKRALDVMNDLRSRTPTAFAQETSDAEAHMVSLYNAGRTILTEEQLQKSLQIPQTAEELTRRKVLRDEAGEQLKTFDSKSVFNEFQSMFVLGDGEPPAPGVLGVMFQEFAPLFKDNYSRLGDANKAKDATVEQLQRNWGFSNTPQGKRFMKYPPEKYYDSHMGSHEYIYEELKKDFEIGPDDDVHLVADNQTVLEIEASKKRSPGLKEPISYSVMVQKDGVWLPQDGRFRAEKTPEMKDKQMRDFTARSNVQRAYDELDQARERLEDAQDLALISQTFKVPQELYDDLKRLKTRARVTEELLQEEKLGGSVNDPPQGVISGGGVF